MAEYGSLWLHKSLLSTWEVVALTLAPLARSISTNWLCPAEAAMISGVQPSSSAVSTAPLPTYKNTLHEATGRTKTSREKNATSNVSTVFSIHLVKKLSCQLNMAPEHIQLSRIYLMILGSEVTMFKKTWRPPNAKPLGHCHPLIAAT